MTTYAHAQTTRYSTVTTFPLIDSVNGFRLHQTALYFESQTQFGDIPGPREGSAAGFLDWAQAVAPGVRVAVKDLSRTAHRRIVVLPHPKRFEQQLPVVVGKVAKTSQRSTGRSDHRLRRAHGSGGQDGAVEHSDRGGGVGRPALHHSCDVQRSRRIAQIVESRTDAHPRRCQPRYQVDNPVELSVGFDVHDPDLQIR